jgi:hypothetical protein
VTWDRSVRELEGDGPLREVQALLNQAAVVSHLRSGVLELPKDDLSTRIVLKRPQGGRPSRDGTIAWVLRIITDIPEPIARLLHQELDTMLAGFNGFTGLGSIYLATGAKLCFGARLTMYEEESAGGTVWRELHLPIVLDCAIRSARPIIDGIAKRHGRPSGMLERLFSGRESSRWTARDLAATRELLAPLCFCNASRSMLTAEFGLDEGAVSAAAGHRTALFQLRTDKPHPALGAGLLCLLQMPHRMGGKSRVEATCRRLNTLDMEFGDGPPHLGAWYPGSWGDNPAYISFVPNELHAVAGLAVHLGIWALHRAEWADSVL